MRDSISNLIIQIKNGSMVGKDSVTVPYSNFTALVADALAKKGYVKSPIKKGKDDKKFLEIGLIYGENGRSKVNDVARISKPSKRIYKGYKEIYKIKQGRGSVVVSTPKGVLTDDEVRKEKVGGEVLFNIW